MLEIIEALLAEIMKIINFLGFFGVAAGMLLESACIPLPSELVLPLAGFMALSGKINLFEANLAAIAGSMVGSYTAYIVGYYGGRPFILKYGKYLFISEKKFLKAEGTFNKYGTATVFFSRLLPVIRTFISLPAGITRMNPVKFGLYSLLGAVPWNLILIYLGYAFGSEYETIVRPYFKKFELVVVLVFAVLVLLLIARTVYKSRGKRA